MCTGDGNQDFPTTSSGDKDPQEVCALASDHGGCSSPATRFYFQPLTGTCQPFQYSGCQGNENNFHSLEECHHFCKDVISAEVSPASSSTSTPSASTKPSIAMDTVSLILDSTTSSVVASTSHDNVDGSLCSLKPERGTCAGSLTRYHYVPELENCVPFIYTGCGVTQPKYFYM